MAQRGRKKLPESIDERIALVDNEIAELEAKLSAKREQREKLVAAKEAEEQAEILEIVKASGLSAAAVKAALEKAKAEAEGKSC